MVLIPAVFQFAQKITKIKLLLSTIKLGFSELFGIITSSLFPCCSLFKGFFICYKFHQPQVVHSLEVFLPEQLKKDGVLT